MFHVAPRESAHHQILSRLSQISYVGRIWKPRFPLPGSHRQIVFQHSQSEDIDKIVMTLSAGGKIVLAYRADCDGRSPCLALCADSLCQTVESTGLEPLIIPSNTNDGQKSIAGYAPSIGFNSDDKPAVAYLHSTKENHTAPEVISLKVRSNSFRAKFPSTLMLMFSFSHFQVALCNHSRCESFTIHNVANFSTSDIPDASQTTTLVAFDVNDGLHVALARNDSVLVFRCADPHACHSWQQTNTIFLPGVVTSISLLPSSAGPGDEVRQRRSFWFSLRLA